MADPSTLLGPIDAVRPVLPFLLVGAVALNMTTRALAHRRHRRQAVRARGHGSGPEPIPRLAERALRDVLGVNVRIPDVSGWLRARLSWGDEADEREDDRADDGVTVSRWLVHEATNVLLLLVAFYFATVQYHGGMVLSVLVLGLVISDFFEFEARRVEARKIEDDDRESLDRPNSALAASMLVLAYTLFQTAFFVVAPVWDAVV